MNTFHRISFPAFALLLLAASFIVPPNLFSAEPVKRTVLENGLTVLLVEDHSLPVVTLRFLIDSGARRDPEGKEGLANLTVAGLRLGTGKRSASEIETALDFLGSTLSSDCSRDYATFTLRSLKKNFKEGFALLMEILTNPSFPEEEIAREIRNVSAAIQAAEDQPGDVAQKEFRRAVFSGGGYAHPVEGTLETVKRIDRASMLGFHRAFYLPNNSILTIVGDLTASEMSATILPLIERWERGRVAETDFRKGSDADPQRITINREITQANIIIGHIGVDRGHPDYYKLQVMNGILGGTGFGSRLMEEIRVRRGLAYSIGSYFSPGKKTGAFQMVLQTQNESAQEAIDILLKEMERIRQEPVSDAELATVKNYLIGSFPLRLVSQASRADIYAQMEYFGLGLDYPERYASLIESVTKEDVQRVAREYLLPEKVIQVIVADLEKAGLSG
jgi:zinc protease